MQLLVLHITDADLFVNQFIAVNGLLFGSRCFQYFSIFQFFKSPLLLVAPVALFFLRYNDEKKAFASVHLITCYRFLSDNINATTDENGLFISPAETSNTNSNMEKFHMQ